MIRFKCNLDGSTLGCALVFLLNFVIKMANWMVLAFLNGVEDYSIFKSIDYLAQEFVTLMLYYIAFEMTCVKAKLEAGNDIEAEIEE